MKRGKSAALSAEVQNSGTRFFLLTLLAASSLAAYWNSFSSPFILDDVRTIVENPAIRSFRTIFSAAQSTRPLTDLSFAANYALFGLNPQGYHVTNFLVHLAASFALFGLIRRTLNCRGQACRAPTSVYLAFAVSIVWALHPLQTQSVVYLSQRAESLAGCFYLVMLYCISRSSDSSRWRFGALAACVLGMASKETMVTAPILGFIYDRIFFASSIKEIVRKRGALYAGLSGSWLLLFLTHFGGNLTEAAKSAGFGFQDVSPLQYALTQPQVILHYLRLSIWPDPLCFDYFWPVAKTVSGILPSLGAVLGLLAGTLFLLRTKPALGIIGFSFFLTLAPTSSIMPIRDLAAEHRMYVPLVFVIAGGVVGLYEALRILVPKENIRLVFFFGLIVTIAIVLGALTHARNLAYESEISIWRDTLAKRPANARAHHNLGAALQEAGDIEEAIGHYEAALALNFSPIHSDANTNLGVAFAQKGNYEKAARYFREALKWDSRSVKARLNLGKALQDQGKVDEAIAQYEEALRLDPDFVDTHNNLGAALTKKNHLEDAVNHLEKALLLDPKHPHRPAVHNNLGIALYSLGRKNDALKHFAEAVRLAPNFREARNNWERVRAELD